MRGIYRIGELKDGDECWLRLTYLHQDRNDPTTVHIIEGTIQHAHEHSEGGGDEEGFGEAYIKAEPDYCAFRVEEFPHTPGVKRLLDTIKEAGRRQKNTANATKIRLDALNGALRSVGEGIGKNITITAEAPEK